MKKHWPGKQKSIAACLRVQTDKFLKLTILESTQYIKFIEGKKIISYLHILPSNNLI